MGDLVGRAFSVWAEGMAGVALSTIGVLTVTADRLVFVGPPPRQPDQVSRLEVPLGQGATATTAPNLGLPDATVFMVTVRWDGKSVCFLNLAEDDATAIAQHVGTGAAPG